MELKFCKSDVYFLNRRKNVKVATYNFVSVYIAAHTCLKNEFTQIYAVNTVVSKMHNKKTTTSIFHCNM